MYKNDRMAHAMIISGGEGTGKLAMALALTALVECEKPIEDEACGNCSQCQKTFKLIHPDVHFFFPFTGSKTKTADDMAAWRAAILENPYLNASHWQDVIEKENKLLNIPADECRAMIHELSLTIYEGKKRILFIWLPEYLGKEGNILLKLIEEPPPNSLILLVTENPAYLLSTIQSRCQLLAISPFKDEDVRMTLMQKGAKDEKQIRNIISSAEGNLFLALNLLQNQHNPQVEKMMAWLRLCLKNNAKGIQEWCDEIAEEGRDAQRQFLLFGLGLLDHIVHYKVAQEEFPAYNPEDWKSIKGLANLLSFDDIALIKDLFSDHASYIERYAHAKILFTALSINLGQVLNKKQLVQ